MSLRIEDFDEFWREVHRPDWRSAGGLRPAPFDWQRRLVAQIASEGRWPDVLDIPTGLGKTTALDIAVFTLALARAGGIDRPLPRRIYLVIDRRIVVDQAFEHATSIGTALSAAPAGSVCAAVADLLRPGPLDRSDAGAVGGGPEEPLVVGRMRGGTTWSWRWLERPDQPAVIVGTIDQLGSRLLFDGYGVGDTLRPIDAALVGTDSLILVDEAHLADAFLCTLADARRIGRGADPLALADPSVVVMSATVPEGVDDPVQFRIDEAAELRDRVAEARLDAAKTLVTAEVKVAQARRVEETGAALAAAALDLSTTGGVVGVVANTVAVARTAFDALRRQVAEADGERCVLVTGRQRPIDRRVQWHEWRDRIEAGRQEPEQPLFVVATQTIEVGADLDFSALVTESASIDALVQRLGRLNRRGDRSTGAAVVVHPSSVTVDDPIYGASRVNTWEWLAGLTPPQAITPKKASLDLSAGADVSPRAITSLLRATDGPVRAAMRMARPVVPVLFPSTLDRWVRTFPRGLDTPPTGPFLHGLERDLPSVSLVWRHAGPRGLGDEAVKAALLRSVEILPPSPDEIIEVPLWAASAWLRAEGGVDAGEVADLSTSESVPDAGRPGASGVPFVVMGRDVEVTSAPARLLPGSVVVVPTWAGGNDAGGWNPGSKEGVIDVADLAEHRVVRSGTSSGSETRRGGRRQVLRLDPETLLPLVGGGEAGEERQAAVGDALAELRRALEVGDPPEDAVATCLDSLRQVDLEGCRLEGPVDELIDNLVGAAGRRRVVLNVDDEGEVSILVHGPGAVEEWSTDATSIGTSLSGEPVTLAQHQRAVARRAEEFAEALGLPDGVREAVVLAAAHHDVGKLDPRFQTMLNGGVGMPAEPLAKSGTDPAAWWMFRRSRQRAGYPSGMRHESFSARAVRGAYADHPEVDLIVHLVASHHGRGRPLEEAVADEQPVRYSVATGAGEVEVRSDEGVDWDQPRRFRGLNERFGPWGLAMLETIVRLADIGCSAEGT